MNTMKLKLLIPFYKNYVAAMSRVSALEMAFSIMLENPRFVASDTVGFNAQMHRKRIFLDLMAASGCEVIVETGTFIGDTTGYLATTTNAKIFTCEANRTFYSLAKSRLTGFPNIQFTHGDSRQFLRTLVESDLSSARYSKPVFFYLDAHWHEDLPLWDEVDIIAKNVKEFVILVDDFQVPGDPGYQYDNYGPKKSLDLETFADCFRQSDVAPFFPSLPASQETGSKRGCVVLTRHGLLSEKLQQLESLCAGPTQP
jgi:hypothetical protein